MGIKNKYGVSICRVTFLAAVFLLIGKANPVPAQSRSAELDSILTVLNGDNLFDGVLLIGEGDRVAYSHTTGLYKGRPVSIRTPMTLASVTKPLTSTVVLSLIDEGRMGLDDPVGRHLKAWPYPDITIRHLLNQTSGLHFLTTINAHADTSKAVRNDDVLALIAEHRPALVFKPGTEFRYDNANFVTLASIVESVTGRSFTDVMRERVFVPAAMDSARIPKHEGTGWLQWIGAGEVEASALDLLSFCNALRSHTLLSSMTLSEAITPPELPGGATSRYGFGWFTYDEPAPMYGHFGDGMEAKSGLMCEMDDATTYVIFIPGDGIHRSKIMESVIQLWNGLPYTLPEPRPIADVPIEVLVLYVGVYDSGMGRLHITLADGMLHLEPEGAGGSEPLIPASETVFYFGHQDLTWEFSLDKSGRVKGLMLEGHPETFGAKVE